MSIIVQQDATVCSFFRWHGGVDSSMSADSSK